LLATLIFISTGFVFVSTFYYILNFFTAVDILELFIVLERYSTPGSGRSGWV
jgi:hypothetical protein